MWFLFDVENLVWWFGFGVVGFLCFLRLGFRGRRVDDYEYCRACGYCLEGLDGPTACVECGGELVSEGRVFVGIKVFRKRCFLWAVLWVSLFWGIGILGQSVWLGSRPVGWLVREAGRNVVGAADRIIDKATGMRVSQLDDEVGAINVGLVGVIKDLGLWGGDLKSRAHYVAILDRFDRDGFSKAEFDGVFDLLIGVIKLRNDNSMGLFSWNPIEMNYSLAREMRLMAVAEGLGYVLMGISGNAFLRWIWML